MMLSAYMLVSRKYARPVKYVKHDPKLLAQEKLDKNKRVVGECWLWTRCCDPSGYGRTKYQGKPVYVHRLSYCLHHKIELENQKDLVLHTRNCLYKLCFNPTHLYAGTQQQNMNDMLAVGLSNRDKTHCAKGHKLDMIGQPCKLCADLRVRRQIRNKRPLGLSAIELQVLGYL
jgi:hypothetical protein